MNSHYANCQCQSCRLEAPPASTPAILSSDRLEDLSTEQLATLRTQLHEDYGATLLPDEDPEDRSVVAGDYRLEIQAMGISTQVDADSTISELWEAVANMEAEALRYSDED